LITGSMAASLSQFFGSALESGPYLPN